MTVPQEHDDVPNTAPILEQDTLSIFSDFDLHLFGQGKHYRIYEKMGAHPRTVNGVEGVHFAVWAPNALSVSVMGDFNDWDPNSLPMQLRVDGWWFIQVPLTHGHHHYLFVVDGTPTLDPQATGTVRADHYAKASMIAVS